MIPFGFHGLLATPAGGVVDPTIVFTSALGVGETSATAIASQGGAPAQALAMTSPLYDLRADVDASVTNAGGQVSFWTSQPPAEGSLVQTVGANKPIHDTVADVVKLTGATLYDDSANGKWFVLPAGTGQLAQVYAADLDKLGVAYFLFRYPTKPTWDAEIMSIVSMAGASSTYRYTLEFEVSWEAKFAIRRGDSSTSVTAAFTTAAPSNTWLAAAWVLNDDRTTPTVSDTVSRLFVKSPANTAFEVMTSVATTALACGGGGSPSAFLNRDGYTTNGVRGVGNYELHSFAFDETPPTTDAAIEDNLDRLLARVA